MCALSKSLGDQILLKPGCRGKWQFDPTRFIKLRPEGERVEIWEAHDAWLIKTMAEGLKRFLGNVLSKHCYHLAGGHKLLLRNIMAWIQQHGADRSVFVYKTDVRNYYLSIQHHILMHQLEKQEISRPLLSLIWSYLTRLVDN